MVSKVYFLKLYGIYLYFNKIHLNILMSLDIVNALRLRNLLIF